VTIGERFEKLWEKRPELRPERKMSSGPGSVSLSWCKEAGDREPRWWWLYAAHTKMAGASLDGDEALRLANDMLARVIYARDDTATLSEALLEEFGA
jgi:uncharacterized protein YceH (UPF0502 family)